MQQGSIADDTLSNRGLKTRTNRDGLKWPQRDEDLSFEWPQGSRKEGVMIALVFTRFLAATVWHS